MDQVKIIKQTGAAGDAADAVADAADAVADAAAGVATAAAVGGSAAADFGDSLFAAQQLIRPRVDRILEQATRSKLVYVIAGAGYGKTQAVRQYIEQQSDAVVRWVQLTESDNISARYWEHLTYNISHDNPELADKLREFGFPETASRFNQFAQILRAAEHRSLKTYLVLDDFHLIHAEEALAFAERCAYLQIPGACVMILSRKEPEINAVSLFARGDVSIVTEDELRFSAQEATDFFRQRDIPLSAQNLPTLIDATKGWALALQLLSLALKRRPEHPDMALDAMKQNIFKLMETEAFQDFPDRVQKTLIRLSLVSNLPLTILHELFQDAALIRSTPQLAAFVWFDSFSGEGRVHPLYWEFLQSKSQLLTGDEEEETYRRAAQWSADNKFYMDAIHYFAKAHQPERILDILLSHPFKLPADACKYILHVLEGVDPENQERDDQSVLTLKCLFVPLLLIGAGRLDEAREQSLAIIREWEGAGTAFSLNLLYTAYSNLAYIDTYRCTITHQYEFLEYLKKSVEYYQQSTIPPIKIAGSFAVPYIRSFACLVGEGAELQEFDQFLETAKQTELYVAKTSHNMYYGYEDLVACELAFLKNQLDNAKHFANQSVLKAREKKQYSIEAMASQYLLRISLHEGNFALAREVIRHLRALLDNPDFWNRQLLYDLFTGFFYAQAGLPELIPPWLVVDDKEAASQVRMPTIELIVCVKSYIALGRFDQARTVLSNAYPREAQERFLFSELTLTLLMAFVRVKTGDAPGAVRDFEKAYALSYQGVFETPFVEMGKNLHPLIVATAKQGGGNIPDAWRKWMDRKASVYAKKASVVQQQLKREQNIDEAIPLSEREREVLKDLYHGLSREEIASHRYLSINTVKKILQSIFIKLDAGNNVDAVRIAIERKLIERE